MTKVKIGIVLAFVVGLLAGHLVTRAGWPEKQAPLVGKQPSPTREFAGKLVISRIDFAATPISEVVEYLRGQSRTGVELENEPPPFRLNFVVVDPDHTARPVDLQLKSVSLERACEHVARVAGLDVAFESDAIVFSTTKGSDAGSRK